MGGSDAKSCLEHYADCRIQVITGEGGGADGGHGGGIVPEMGDPLLDEAAAILYDLFDDYRAHLQLEAPIRAIVGDAQSNEDLTPAQLEAMTPLQDQLSAFLGGLRPFEFYGPREERVEALLDEYLAGKDFFSDVPAFSFRELMEGRGAAHASRERASRKTSSAGRVFAAPDSSSS